MTNLETKRLILRNWKSEDKDSLYELAKDHEIGQDVAGYRIKMLMKA